MIYATKRIRHSQLLFLFATLATTTTLGCSGGAEPTSNQDVDPSLVASARGDGAQALTPESFSLGPFVDKLQDDQILGVLGAVNLGVISQGVLAGPRATSVRVLSYARD